MKNKSTGYESKTESQARVKREMAALDRMPDSEIDFSDIPPQDPNDSKWHNAVVGRFYRPRKERVSLRVDADVLAWLKKQGAGYQSRINAILREQMTLKR